MKHTRQEATQTEPSITPPRRFVNSSSKDLYVPTWTDTRPGAQDHENVPSRRVATREWRDGRKEAA